MPDGTGKDCAEPPARRTPAESSSFVNLTIGDTGNDRFSAGRYKITAENLLQARAAAITNGWLGDRQPGPLL
ncbi:MAG: hypothetical protein Fues2KO_49340 [Fuerstiella sp.]